MEFSFLAPVTLLHCAFKMHLIKCLPTGFLMAEIPQKVQQVSTNAEISTRRFFEELNPSDMLAGTPTFFQKLSASRWLVHGKVLAKILQSWRELVVFFFKGIY